MSTVKTINIIHPSGSTTNIVNDSSGNMTVGGTMAMSSSFMRNRIINGAMVVDQRNAGASVTPTSGQYLVDRWYYIGSQASKFTAQQNAGAITPPTGFSNYLGMTVASAVTVGASDYFGIVQPIEGFNFSDVGFGTASAKTVTLSFQVYSSLTGTFGASLINYAVNRSYPFSYTVSSSNTWTSVSVTIPGDTTGTWVGATNSVGVYVRFGLGSGSTFSSTANAWGAGNFVQPTSSVSVVGTNGATFYITGVQLEVGSVATPFEREIYSQTLAKCQRYYWKSNTQSGTPGIIGNAYQAGMYVGTGWSFPVQMRVGPTVSKVGTWLVSNCSQPAIWQNDINGFVIFSTASAAGVVYFNPSNAGCYVEATGAEL